jgi:ATP adenylyltransferase
MIGSQIRTQVRERAQNACEYCHLHQDDSPLAALHVEHIIPRIHGGSDDIDNLALPALIAIFTKERI